MAEKTSVLIVGAGPTGLMLACQLALQKIPFIIVEKESGPTDESRALGIQARTMEIFQQMGIADEFVKAGQPARGLNFLANGRLVRHVPLSGLGEGLTRFPYLLTHEQSKTEANLVNFLKQHHHTVQYSTEVLSFTQHDSGVTTQVKDKHGKETTLESDWIVGADGAHSIVRHILGIKLAGKTYRQSLFVLDCHIESDLSRDDITISTSDESFAAFFPMTENRWRIVGEVPPAVFGKDTITFAEVEKDFARLLRMDLKLSDPDWISLYHAHHRCVTHFQEGRAFLLGDASNIHSPIGAQGMNTGLQDAYNLAWKLAFVHKKLAAPELLETYNAERLPFAKRLVATTDRLFNLFVSNNKISIFLREHVLPWVVKNAISHKKSGHMAFRTISQIGISYHSSPLSQDSPSGDFPPTAPKPGDRLPYLLYEEKDKKINIQDLIQPTSLNLLLFPGEQPAPTAIRNLAKDYEKVLAVIEIPLTQETKKLYESLGIKEAGYYLIRPDVYIAYRNNRNDISHLRSYLTRFFLK